MCVYGIFTEPTTRSASPGFVRESASIWSPRMRSDSRRSLLTAPNRGGRAVSEMPPMPPPPIRLHARPHFRGKSPTPGWGRSFRTVVQFVTGPFAAFGKMSLTIDLVRPIAYSSCSPS